MISYASSLERVAERPTGERADRTLKTIQKREKRARKERETAKIPKSFEPELRNRESGEELWFKD